MRRFVSWVVVLGVLSWIGYTVAAAGWSYLATQEMVDKILRDASARHRAAFATGNQAAVDALAEYVRAAILLGAARDGLRMDERDVTVSANSAGLSATVGWSYPIISYQSSDILVIPLSVQRSVAVTP
jgi:hypothetical protein